MRLESNDETRLSTLLTEEDHETLNSTEEGAYKKRVKWAREFSKRVRKSEKKAELIKVEINRHTMVVTFGFKGPSVDLPERKLIRR